MRFKTPIIKSLCSKQKWSIPMLAKEAGVNPQYLSNLLGKKPRSNPTEKFIGKVAAALNVEPWQIAEGLEPLEDLGVKLSEGTASVIPLPTALKEDPCIAELINYLNEHPNRIGTFYTLYEICILLNDKKLEGGGFMEVIAGYRDRLKNLG